MNLDTVTLAINGGEALLLIVAMSTLLAMTKVAFPLCAVYFAVDMLHNFSGKYLDEPTTAGDLVISAIVSVAAVAYVWYLRRKELLH